MDKSALVLAREFIENETPFHLGFLPTEQSNPQTAGLDKTFAADLRAGVKLLQSVDRNVLIMARKLFETDEFGKLVTCGTETLKNGGRIVFSGCGATGRLSILLESMWRDCCLRNIELQSVSDQVFSIMTGGDFALVKSVESFEDFQVFGRRQVADLDMGDNDMLVAITEGGETSSVLGTVFEALDRNSRVFLMFNNPAALLAERLERSRRAICDPRVTVLDLFCGPMALAGSTRMQATTSEQLICSAALELIAAKITGRESRNDFADGFALLLDTLETAPNVAAIADYIGFEASVYRSKGLVTYFVDEYMLDIFTDTTERSPTFMLPPFRKNDDPVSPRPWAFVKNPLLPTAMVWQKGLHRPLRCLNWMPDDYRDMNAPEKIISSPPAISREELLKFEIGKDDIADRISGDNDAAVLVMVAGNSGNMDVADSFGGIRKDFAVSKIVAIGGNAGGGADFFVDVPVPATRLRIWEHLAVKLVLNTVSTGVMAVLGRVSGNWMSYVNVSNKKLMDRGIRLISELGGIDYESACIKIFEALEFLESHQSPADEGVSVVQYVLANLPER